jgi:Xaa-Pro aminopeptidase
MLGGPILKPGTSLFAMPDFAERRNKLRRLLKGAGVDSLLVTDFTNVTYLTGFTGDSSYLLVKADGKSGGETLLSDFRYITQLEEECPGLDVVIRKTGIKVSDAVRDIASKHKASRLGIEGGSMTVALRESLHGKVPGELVSTSGLVEQLREIKDKEEVEEIRQAVKIASKAFAAVRATLRPEQTEKEVADELEAQVRRHGGQCTSFTPIVGVGKRGALPHGRPLPNVHIRDDEFVLIDWGARGRQYVSDLTRILVTGRISPKLERVYGVVLKAQLAAIEAIRPGALMKDVDAAARNVIAKAGFGDKFGHSLGHGIGLQVHEQPRLAVDQDRPLKAGMVVTVEPGIYLPDWGGVRIEDDVLVTKSGHEVLSSVPKQLEECVVEK